MNFSLQPLAFSLRSAFALFCLSLLLLRGLGAPPTPSSPDKTSVQRTNLQPATASHNKPGAPFEEVELRGRIICIPEVLHRLYQSELPANHQHIVGFQTADQTIYTLLRVKMSEALFDDPAMARKELLLKGRIFPGTKVFEPTRLRSIKDGKVHDLYYYCAICEIQGVSPGECMCCRGPVELIEKPL